jgi:hypothetical protein
LVSRTGEALDRAYPERDGKLRHPRYEGLRHDKPAREVVREAPAT